jgi:hypothetical protein
MLIDALAKAGREAKDHNGWMVIYEKLKVYQHENDILFHFRSIRGKS